MPSSRGKKIVDVFFFPESTTQNMQATKSEKRPVQLLSFEGNWGYSLRYVGLHSSSFYFVKTYRVLAVLM